MFNWTFKKERHRIRTDEQLFLYGADGIDSFADYNDCALILGKLHALFGEPTTRADYDDFYTYDIVAEAPDKDTVGLYVHEHNNAPSVDYPEGAEDAARAFADLLGTAKPKDYEYDIKCKENFRMITYFVKDGKAGSRDRNLTIKEIFDGNPSPEDIEMFTALGYKLE